MADTWIVDLRHYLTPAGTIVDRPSPVRIRAEYFASIVVDATTNGDGTPHVHCRRRPRHQRCRGLVRSYFPTAENESIRWHCPVCNDNRIISGWQNTRWDGRASGTVL